MKTEQTDHWLEAITEPPKRGEKNRSIGRRQILNREALKAELKAETCPWWVRIFKRK